MSSLKNFICKQSRVFYLNIALTKSNNNFVCVLIYKYILEASFMPSNNNTNNCREDSPGRECRVQSDRRGGAGPRRRASATRCKRQLWHETGATSWQSEVSGWAGVARCLIVRESFRQPQSMLWEQCKRGQAVDPHLPWNCKQAVHSWKVGFTLLAFQCNSNTRSNWCLGSLVSYFKQDHYSYIHQLLYIPRTAYSCQSALFSAKLPPAESTQQLLYALQQQ